MSSDGFDDGLINQPFKVQVKTTVSSNKPVHFTHFQSYLLSLLSTMISPVHSLVKMEIKVFHCIYLGHLCPIEIGIKLGIYTTYPKCDMD